MCLTIRSCTIIIKECYLEPSSLVFNEKLSKSGGFFYANIAEENSVALIRYVTDSIR